VRVPLPGSQRGGGDGRTIAWTAHKEREPDVKLNGELHGDHRPSLRCDELEAMLIYSMSVSVDGFISDREGAFGWTAPNELGGYLCGRRLYETMLPDGQPDWGDRWRWHSLDGLARLRQATSQSRQLGSWPGSEERPPPLPRHPIVAPDHSGRTPPVSPKASWDVVDFHPLVPR
jgi:hypothetical protein